MSIIGSYTGDIIDIIRNAKDQWGVITLTEQLDIDAYVEVGNRLVKNFNGIEVMGKMTIFLDPSIDIQENDRIRVKKLRNRDTQNPNKQYALLNLWPMHGFEHMDWEVVI
jgi:hypothetical protein